MSIDLRATKDRAAQLHARGKFEAAAAEYLKVLKATPHDLATRQRVADLLARAGRPKDAIVEYQQVAGRYALDGHLLKAVAVCKVILRLDPTHVETQQVLARLYTQQGGGTVTVPASMTASIRSITATRLSAVPDPGAAPVASPAVPAPVAAPPAVNAPPGNEFETLIVSPTVPTGDIEPDGHDVDLDIDVQEHSSEIVVAPRALPSIPLFSNLPPDAFIALSERLQLLEIKAGDIVVREGDIGHSVFAIVQGTMQVLRPGPDGTQRVVAEMREGSFFGEMALITAAPRVATVRAGTDAVLLELARERVDELVALQPSVQGIIESFYRDRLLANLMRSSPLFRPLDDAAREALARQFVTVNAAPGQVILKEGDTGDGFYVVLRGSCRAIGLSHSGRPSPLSTMREGDFFGEISMLLDRTVTATVEAESQSVLLRLPRDVFVQTVAQHPEVHRRVVQVGRERLQRTADLQEAGETYNAYNV